MSDLLDNLKNADPYADPDHVCDLIVEVVDEIERLRTQVATLREALLAVTYAAHELCAALDIDLDETVIRGKNFLTDEVVAQKSLADIFAQVAAALEEK